MKKECPSCKSKIDKNLVICPNCGFHFDTSVEVKQDETKESVQDGLHENDEIEWAELRDVSLESVMEMFKNNEDEPAESTELEEDSSIEKKMNDTPKTDVMKNNDESQEEKDDTKEFSAEVENPLLAAYIQAHKENADSQAESHFQELVAKLRNPSLDVSKDMDEVFEKAEEQEDTEQTMVESDKKDSTEEAKPLAEEKKEEAEPILPVVSVTEEKLSAKEENKEIVSEKSAPETKATNENISETVVTKKTEEKVAQGKVPKQADRTASKVNDGEPSEEVPVENPIEKKASKVTDDVKKQENLSNISSDNEEQKIMKQAKTKSKAEKQLSTEKAEKLDSVNENKENSNEEKVVIKQETENKQPKESSKVNQEKQKPKAEEQKSETLSSVAKVAAGVATAAAVSEISPEPKTSTKSAGVPTEQPKVKKKHHSSGKKKNAQKQAKKAADKNRVEPATTEVEKQSVPKNSQKVIAQEANKATTKESLENKKATTQEEEPKKVEPIKNKQASKSKEKPKRKKTPYLALAAILLFVGGGWFIYENHQKEVEAQRVAEVEKKQEKIKELTTQIDAYYTDGTQEYIKPNMLSQDLLDLKPKIDKLKGESGYKKLLEKYEETNKKLAITEQIDDLFKEPILNGDTLQSNAVLKNDQKVVPISVDSETGFGKLINQAQDEATEQYTKLQDAKIKTAVVYKDGNVQDKATRAQYTAAKTAVDKIANKDLAKPLQDGLKKVSDTLTKEEEAKKKAEEEKAAKEKAEKEKAEAEAAQQAAAQAAAEKKAAEEQAAKVAVATTTTSSSTSSANQPILSTNASDVADTTNIAWTWASGVKESVIATCIQRGYITEGNYTLEKVKIENGEGYYNLYATNNTSELTKDIGASGFPFYIVTINCKTGWFGGNGPN